MNVCAAQKITLGVLLAAAVIPALFLSPLIKKLTAATCTWSGGSGTWSSAGNWSNCGGGVPGAGDDVVINSNVTVTLSATTTINSLTLGNSSGTTTPTLNFNYNAITNGALIIDDSDLIVYPNATITHTIASGDTVVGNVYIDVQTGSATISGTINANQKGYPGGARGRVGYGPGGGNPSGSSRAGGAGYGGKGANGDAAGGNSYGSLYAPTHLGSGGAGGGSTSNGTTGGTGGGAVKLTVVATTTISGSITANGGNGANDASDNDSGGGAGGTISVTTQNLSGSGSISANGGLAYDGAGGGAGGRVVLSYSNTNTFAGSWSAALGSGGSNGYQGTFLVINSTNNDVVLPVSQSWDADPSLEGSSHTFRDVTIQDSSTLTILGHYTTGTDGIGITFNVRNFSLGAGSAITGNSLGYAGGSRGVAGTGPGAGQPSPSAQGGGAGYGGKGGKGAGAGGVTYGSLTAPDDLGSGGAGGGSTSVGVSGASGGAAISIQASGTVTIGGTLTMNGGNGVNGGSDDMSGGGSGGSVYINCATFAGGGGIEASGGNGVGGSGGGGGGRISIKYSTSNTYSGSVVATKGSGSGQEENGTLVVIDSGNNDLYLSTSQTWYAKPTVEERVQTYRDVYIQNDITLTLQGYNTTNTNGVGFTFNVRNFSLCSGCKIDGDGRGYPGGPTEATDGYGPGRSTYQGYYQTGGAGYGGVGSTSSGGSTGGASYGSEEQPTDLGSGSAGGGSGVAGPAGSPGGGAIKIAATGTVTIDGWLSMNGIVGKQYYTNERLSGGGSGGSIFITCDTFTGTGTIQAKGGDGYNLTGYSGGGGGGRIAIRYDTGQTWAGSSLNAAIATAKGAYGTSGGDGTVLFLPLLALGEVFTEINVSNTAPVFSVSPFEAVASASTTPTNVGTAVTFRATATDVNEDNYYLAICKTDAISPGSGSPPTCSGGQWCRSSATTQGTQASCNYTTLLADVEVNAWFAFVCDGTLCSGSDQGSGDSGSPFEVNHAPTISGTSAGSGNPQGYGSGYTITVNTTASDSDSSGSSDSTKVVVCADNSGATSSGCNGGDDLCSSSLVASDPSCNFDLPATIDDGDYNYYAYVFDSHNFGTNVASSTYTVNSTPPIVTSVTLNSGSDITLNDLHTNGGVTNVILTATVTDYNSCQDLSSVSGYLYRTGITYAGCTAQDANNCYYNVSCSTSDCSGSSDDTATYTCTVSMQYHADPTDGSNSTDSVWYAETWKDTIKAVDGAAGEDNTEVITGVEVNSTTAFAIATALAGPKISYGNMTIGTDSGLIDDTDTNQITTLTATGNVGLDQEISGTTLIYSSYTIPIANQKHGFSAFTYSSGGTALSGTTTEYEQNCLKTTVTATPETAKTYWGILIPSNTGSGTYSGTNYLNGVKGEAGDW